MSPCCWSTLALGSSVERESMRRIREFAEGDRSSGKVVRLLFQGKDTKSVTRCVPLSLVDECGT